MYKLNEDSLDNWTGVLGCVKVKLQQRTLLTLFGDILVRL